MRVSLVGVRVFVAFTFGIFVFLLFVAPAKSQSAVTIISSSKQSPVQTNLVSDIPGLAVTTDPNLINPWGISNSPTSPYWISDQGVGKSTLYNGAGTPTALVVTIPAIGIASGPTGTVFNGTPGFLVSGTASNFIFATLDGTIAARASGSTAVTEATVAGAVFTGLTLANNGTANYLFAANFVSGGTIQVFDSTFTSTTLGGSFTDPTLPMGYAPYNIQLLNGKLYVAYAEVGMRGATIGTGLGLVSVFDTNGNFLQRLISNGNLNAPWGMTMAPAGFMAFANDLLVGNFGDGKINAFDPTTGSLLGTISDSEGRPLANPGLWAIEFGNGNTGSSPTALYFNAGINSEQDGLFGSISPGPITLIFAGQLVNTPSAVQTLTVENTGNASLVLAAAPSLGATTEFAIATGTTCISGATIAPGSSCIINVTFTPSAAGARGPVNLSISDNAASSPQGVVLSGTGTAGTPTVTLSPATPLTFSGQLVTTTSAAQTVTVTNTGTATLTFGAQGISVSNDFTQTNTCNGVSVAVNATCAISVSFAPSGTSNNPRTGTLSIADNATGTPQTTALSGTGLDFSLSLPSTASTTAGTAASVTITIGALGGFTGPVTITCSGAIPQGSCVAPSAPVMAPGTAILTFMTSSYLAPRETMRRTPASSRPIVFVLPILGLVFALLTARRVEARFGLAGATLVLTLLAGCGNGSSSSTGSTRTPAGSYAITVTGTSSGASRTSTVTLTVN
jgi:uncharacterized protein (TIGR03118 family)